jgi:hypothetical protein
MNTRMTHCLGMPIVALSLACVSPCLSAFAQGHTDGDAPPSPCPGAQAWKRAHPEDSLDALAHRDESRTFTDPELRQQLQRRFDADQSARKEYLAAPKDPELARKVAALDAQNLVWLKKLVHDRGIPTAAQVGENGVRWTWLLIQHADRDPKLQATTLPMFAQRYEAGELSAENLAKLTDRVLIAFGRPQKFGTQFDWFSGHFNPRNAGDLAVIDANREAIGLMPLADYACLMNTRLSAK